MSDTAEELIERNHIIECINRLFIGTDNHDWTMVKQCFAASVLFDMSSMGAGDAVLKSPDEITTMWDAGLKPLKAIHHQVGNYLVSINGAEAEAFCYGVAYHYLPNNSNANTRSFIGSYDMTLNKEGSDWLISKFRFNLKFIDGNLELESS